MADLRVLVLLIFVSAVGACAAPIPTATPAPVGTAFVATPAPPALAVVARLRAAGLDAQATGEKIPSLLGPATGEVVRAEGLPVQVYAFADAAAAERALQNATTGPASQLLDWIATPHFVRLDHLLVAVVTDDEALAARITAALGR